jgi:hypothetical protein
MNARYDWDAVLPQAAEIVQAYSTRVTLRQLFYRLVAAHLLPNIQESYKALSAKTAEVGPTSSAWCSRGGHPSRPMPAERSVSNRAEQG